jgi:hypothetical protein
VLIKHSLRMSFERSYSVQKPQKNQRDRREHDQNFCPDRIGHFKWNGSLERRRKWGLFCYRVNDKKVHTYLRRYQPHFDNNEDQDWFCRKVWRRIKKLEFCSLPDTFGRKVSEIFSCVAEISDNLVFQRPKRRSAKNTILQEKTLRQYQISCGSALSLHFRS